MPIQDMPQVFTFPLVKIVAEDAKLSKGQARKFILRGWVTVNGAVVKDPVMRVDASMRIAVYKP